MSIPINFSGGSYAIPSQAERNWADILNTYLIALSSNTLPRSGGAFSLAADLDLGNTANISVKSLVSKTAGPSATGFLRLAKTDVLSFRNNANTADLSLGINASDQLTFNGSVVPVAASTVTLAGTQTLTNKTLTSPVLNTPTTSGEIVANYTDYTQVATPASPGAGVSRIYAKNDAKLYQIDNSGIEKQLGGGGLSPVAVSANVTLAVINTMYEATSTGGFTITLPTIPASGGVIGVMDAGETCSATNFVRVTPASGQSIDGYVANDSLVLDYVVNAP